MKGYIALVIACVFLSSCQPKYTPHNPPKPKHLPHDVQQVATLAFVAYAGDALENTDPRVDQKLEVCVAEELDRQQFLENRFSLAWGPSVYRFELAELDDNMMYAVWDAENEKELVISIRGTNFASISDWIDEDFFVTETVPWRYERPENVNARITKATDIGLRVLQGMKGKNHSSDCNGSILLEDFLMENVKNGKLNKVTVTGHSLAGALAPVFALWLKDEVFVGDKREKVAVHVLPIAGATAGNAEFAEYYDSRLGGHRTNRLHNPFDVVPQAWVISSMEKLPSIYFTPKPDEHSIQPKDTELLAFNIGIELAKHKNYAHIKALQASTGGVISSEAKDANCRMTYASQAAWQHHCGYYNAIGMAGKILNTNSYCFTQGQCENPQGTDEEKKLIERECKLLKQYDQCTDCKTRD